MVPEEHWGDDGDHAGHEAARPRGRAGPLGRRPHRALSRALPSSGRDPSRSPRRIPPRSRVSGRARRAALGRASGGRARSRRPGARAGSTRWPSNSRASASSRPSSSRGPNAGTGRTVGRCSTSPSVSAKLGVAHGHGRRQVDRAGHVAAEQVDDRADLVVEADPAHPLAARPEAAAEPELEQRQHP